MTTGSAPRILLRDLFDAPWEGTSSVGGTFQPLHPGVDILPLYGPSADDAQAVSEHPSAALIRYQPGASVPRHRHKGYEHILVLSGSQHDEHGSYAKGTCVMSPPGSSHAVHSREGCLVLAIWDHPIEIL